MATQGWTYPVNARKAHYVLNGRTFCRRWVVEFPFRRLFLHRRHKCRECQAAVFRGLDNGTLPVQLPDPLARDRFDVL
jgi:hypothetical protein